MLSRDCAQISPEKFQAAFGAPIESAMDLLASKALSISKLLVLAPPGTLDPTPHLYDSTMYALSGMMVMAFVAQGMVRPLAPLAAGAAEVAAVAAASKGTVVDIPGTVISDAAQPVKEATAGDRLVK